MSELRIGVLGSGGRGQIAEHAHKPEQGVTIVACCDIQDEVLEKNKKTYGSDICTTTDIETFLAQDMDAVFICTPDYLHEEQAVACLDRGLSVYLEKPMAISIEGCDRVLAAAEKSSGKLFVGHNMRYMNIIIKMKKLIDDGVIGTVKSIWCRHFISYGGDAYFRDWHSEQRYSNSLLLQKGAHDIDVMHWLTGAQTTRVAAFGNNAVYDKLPRRNPEESSSVAFITEHWPPMEQKDFSPQMDMEDQNTMIMHMENGILGTYMQCHFSPDSCRNYTVIGTKGRLENFGDSPNSPIMVWNQRSDTYNMVGDEVHRGDIVKNAEGHGGADAVIVKEFIDYISGTIDQTTATPEAARMSVAVGCQAAVSLRNGGQPLDIPAIV